MWKPQLLAFVLVAIPVIAQAMPPKETTAIQQRLTELGYKPGPVDGLYGHQTKVAVKKFQRDNKLPATGKMDDATTDKLGWRDDAREAEQAEQAAKAHKAAEAARELAAEEAAAEAEKQAAAPPPEPIIEYGTIGADTTTSTPTKPKPTNGWQGGPLVALSYEFGGDRIATAQFSNGDTENLDAGEGLTLSGGGWLKFPNTPISIKGALGYKIARISSGDDEVLQTRFVTETLGRYHFLGAHTIGAGVTYHFNHEIDIDVSGNNLTVDVDDAIGFMVEYRWRFFGLSYTKIDYEDELNNDIDGSNFGVSFGYEF